MISHILCTTILYGLFSIVVIFPPQEAVSAGITIENFLSFWLKSESLSFVQYHVRRTSATVVAHALLLPGYVVCLLYFHPILWTLAGSIWPSFMIVFSFLPVFVAMFFVYKWSRNNWKNHPFTLNISIYSSPDDTTRHISNQIDNEFVSIDKVTSEENSVSRVIATETWLIKVTSYYIHLLSLRDAVLVLENCEEALLVPSSTAPAQMISVRVASLKESIPPFSFRINSVIWGDLERKLRNPVVNTRQIVIHQTLADKFAVVFEETVRKNPTKSVETEPDLCIGCMAVRANVTLDRRCRSVDVSSECTPCSCRPMWCLSCLSKWFAARQDQRETETWLSSNAPCPTCRSKFCLLDVFIIEN